MRILRAAPSYGEFCCLLILVAIDWNHVTTAAEVDFKTQIRPLLSNKCFHCHGPDQAARQADLRLDLSELAVGKQADAPFVPFELDSSAAWKRIMSNDPEVQMPPPSSGKALSATEKELIQKWIEQGAMWSQHWSFIGPRRPRLPDTAVSDPLQSPLDALVAIRLATEKLPPNPPAASSTLVRRLYLDLLGVPPSQDQVNEFLHSESPNRIPQLVDQLLASPHYGERWARPWLDAGRYADSDGFEKDKPRSVWLYRDWVVEAINRDLPYDDFVIQQLAGDLVAEDLSIERDKQSSIIATGFLRNSMINEEGGVDPEQFRMEAMFDRMDTIGRAVLGLTTGCSQCHDHKFDPMTQDDYYRMMAIINNSHEGSQVVYTAAQQERKSDVLSRIANREQQLRDMTPDWRMKMSEWESTVRGTQPKWIPLELDWDHASLGGCKLLPQSDGSYLALSYAPTKSEFWGQCALAEENITGLQLELMVDPNLPRNGPGRSIFGTAALSEIKVFAAPADKPGERRQVKIASATSDVNPPKSALPKMYDDKSKKERWLGPVEMAIDGDELTAWSTDRGPGRVHQPCKSVFVFDTPLSHTQGTRLWVHLSQKHGGWNSDDNQNCNLGRFRIGVTTAKPAVADPLPAKVRLLVETTTVASRTDSENLQVFQFWRTQVEAWKMVNEEIENIWAEHPVGESQLVMQERKSHRPTQMLERGDPLKPTRLVSAGTPTFLHRSTKESGELNRLDFARWLVDRNSPTTARAIVNRHWQLFFGTGLSSTTEDLGSQGEVPIYPELLDWLSVEFMESSWSVKHLHRCIVLTDVYQQASTVRPDHLDKDASNRLLARGPRTRLEGELIRDNALRIAGLLDRTVGGEPVYPPAPDFLFQPPVSYGPKTWIESKDSNRYRRSLYTFRFRSILYPPLQVFDVPNGDASCVKRTNSNTPMQSLTLLNETLFMECSQAFARRIAMIPRGSVRDKIQWAFRETLSRDATEEEMGTLERSWREIEQSMLDTNIAKQIAGWDNPCLEAIPSADTHPRELACWTAIARILLNLDETVSKE